MLRCLGSISTGVVRIHLGSWDRGKRTIWSKYGSRMRTDDQRSDKKPPQLSFLKLSRYLVHGRPWRGFLSNEFGICRESRATVAPITVGHLLVNHQILDKKSVHHGDFLYWDLPSIVLLCYPFFYISCPTNNLSNNEARIHGYNRQLDLFSW